MKNKLKHIFSSVVHKWEWAFKLRQNLTLLPALLAGQMGGKHKTWSEFNEDKILIKMLSKSFSKGFFVDVGANHPTAFSNTYRLYCHGMRGITIEPNDQLASMHKNFRQEDIVLNVAIGPNNGFAIFYEMGFHALSTFSEEVYKSHVNNGVKFIRKSYKPMFKLSTILEFCAPSDRDEFALLSIDAEGWDEIVLGSNDWDRFRPNLIIVESNSLNCKSKINQFLLNINYSEICVCGVNTIYKSIHF
jgi:FkbM family methyltransferase